MLPISTLQKNLLTDAQYEPGLQFTSLSPLQKPRKDASPTEEATIELTVSTLKVTKEDA